MQSEYVATKETLTQMEWLLAPKHKVYLISDWSWVQRVSIVDAQDSHCVHMFWYDHHSRLTLIVPVFVFQAEWRVCTCTGVHKNACVYTYVYEFTPTLASSMDWLLFCTGNFLIEVDLLTKGWLFSFTSFKTLIVHLNYFSFSHFYKNQNNIILAMAQCFFGSWQQFGWLRICSEQTNV